MALPRDCGVAHDPSVFSSNKVLVYNLGFDRYVHITAASLAETARLKAQLADHGVHSIGCYGGWTCCSIEDNLIETRALAQQLS